MSTQGRTSDQPSQLPQIDAATATPAAGEGTNLLHRWVRLVQQSALWGNDAGQLRLDELASGPTTPRLQTLEQIRAARTAAVADEEAAEGAGGTSWWEDAVCTDAVCTDDDAVEKVCETETAPPIEEPGVCALDAVNAEAPSFITLPPPVTPVLPAAGEGLLSRILTYGARRLGPVVVGMWPKPTAPPEMTDYPDVGPEGGLEPVGDELPKDDNKCEAEKAKHRGGEEVHNQCADSIPGNAAAGGDWKVTTPEGEAKNFDAWTPADNTVWEVKTNRVSEYPRFLREEQVRKHVAEAVVDNKIAERCGYRYAFQVSDPEHYRMIAPLLAPLGVDVVFQPECLRQQEEP